MSLASINPEPPATPRSIRLTFDGNLVQVLDHTDDLKHGDIVSITHKALDSLLSHAELVGGSLLFEVIPPS